MEKTYNVSWSRHTIIMTIIVLAVVAATCALIIPLYGTWGIAISALLLVIALASALFAPLRLVLTDDTLTVKRIIGSKTIARDQIIKCNAVDAHQISLLRLCGVGGFCGYTGWFYNKTLGKMFLYVGDFSQALLLTTAHKRVYMLSCDSAISLVSELQNT